MTLNERIELQTSDFLEQSAFGIAVTVALLVAPVAIYHLFWGQLLLGLGGLWIVFLMVVNAWLSHRGNYKHWLTQLCVVPAIFVFLLMCYSSGGLVGALWNYPSIVSFYCLLPERKAWFANILLLVIVAPIAWSSLEHEFFLRLYLTLICVSIFSVIFVRSISINHKRLIYQVETDPLTGLKNRTQLIDILSSAIDINSRAGTLMSLIYLDVDHFKNVNDDYGHAEGDRILKEMGSILLQRFRAVDSLFRIGGEEFLVLLFDSNRQDATHIAQLLRHQIEQHDFSLEKNITVSMGVAQLQDGDDCASWMKRADTHLYIAKQTRNKVVAA